MHSKFFAIGVISLISITHAFNMDCSSNVAGYWGQNSYGAANGGDKSNWQKPLHEYCNDDTIDMFPIAFLTKFFSTGGQPEINLANTCSNVDDPTFPGTALANCTSKMQDDIIGCQKRGKVLTISLGGATGGVGFQSDDQAESFADTIWNLFLGGSSDMRPFGSAILDGVDLDIEGGGSAHYTTFLNKLKGHFGSSDRKYYITAAPQCVYPDANLQETINSFPMDAIFVQFYNNPCGLQTYGQPQWNFGQWDYWARNVSPNKNVKVYIGAPASSSAAGGGYVSADQLGKIASETQKQFPSFGGVMYWDVSQAYGNNRFDKAIKEAISQGSSSSCGSSFQLPPCDAPAYSKRKQYPGGSKVSYKYIWQAKWFTDSEPDGGANSEWTAVSSCSDGDASSSSSSGNINASASSTSSSDNTADATSTGSMSDTLTASASSSDTTLSTWEVGPMTTDSSDSSTASSMGSITTDSAATGSSSAATTPDATLSTTAAASADNTNYSLSKKEKRWSHITRVKSKQKQRPYT